MRKCRYKPPEQLCLVRRVIWASISGSWLYGWWLAGLASVSVLRGECEREKGLGSIECREAYEVSHWRSESGCLGMKCKIVVLILAGMLEAAHSPAFRS